MDAFEFVNKYESYLEEISMVIMPELESVVKKLREIDSHDLIKPDSWFLNECEAKGFVWTLFIKRVKLVI